VTAIVAAIRCSPSYGYGDAQEVWAFTNDQKRILAAPDEELIWAESPEELLSTLQRRYDSKDLTYCWKACYDETIHGEHPPTTLVNSLNNVVVCKTPVWTGALSVEAIKKFLFKKKSFYLPPPKKVEDGRPHQTLLKQLQKLPIWDDFVIGSVDARGTVIRYDPAAAKYARDFAQAQKTNMRLYNQHERRRQQQIQKNTITITLETLNLLHAEVVRILYQHLSLKCPKIGHSSYKATLAKNITFNLALLNKMGNPHRKKTQKQYLKLLNTLTAHLSELKTKSDIYVNLGKQLKREITACKKLCLLE